MTLIRKTLTVEPVMSATFAAGLLVAVANALRVYGVYDLTAEQQQSILDLFPYVTVLVGFVVRQQVTPTARQGPTS